MPRLARLAPLLIALALPAEAAQRAYVASHGSDINTATQCTLANPCRSFAAAHSVVDAGGEVVALDAAGYGPLTITKSVTITANPGFFAGIAAAGGNAVTIATPGVGVILRGLNINGLGADFGVLMAATGSLSIENCVISNFAQDGVRVVGDARVRILNSLVRNNVNNGAYLAGGATAEVASSHFIANGFIAVSADGAVAATTTTAVVTDSVLSHGGFGAVARSIGPGDTRVAVMRTTTSSNSSSGFVAVSTEGASAILTLSSSLSVRSFCGVNVSGANAVLETTGNNTVRQNTTDICTPQSGGAYSSVGQF